MNRRTYSHNPCKREKSHHITTNTLTFITKGCQGSVNAFTIPSFPAPKKEKEKEDNILSGRAFCPF